VTNTAPFTPAEAFDQLQERVRHGLPVIGRTALTDYSGHAERFLFGADVRDQSAAFPRRRVDVTALLLVITMDTGQLLLRLTAMWTSIYGSHLTEAVYLISKNDSDISIMPHWGQTLPVSTLDNLEIHTGGISVDDYHQRALNELRSFGSAIGGMLYDGIERSVEPTDLVGIVDMIAHSTPEL